MTSDTPQPAKIITLADQARKALEATKPKTEPRQPINWGELEGREPPPRLWRINHWLGAGPALLAGSGGVGKSLLAQTMATALAWQRFFLDEVPDPLVVLMWMCEDDRDEIWRRQVAICAALEIPMSSLQGKLIIEPRLGRDNALFALPFNQPAFTPLHTELREQVNDYKADLVVLDNAGQVFGGNENDRHHVTMFLNGISGMSLGLSSLILAHPAKGVGSEFSGSTAWENAVRMRWYLGRTLPDQDEAKEAEDGVLYLAKRKSNYSTQDWRRVTYRNGALIPDAAAGDGFSYSAAARKSDARRCVLASLRKVAGIGLAANASTASPDYLPRRAIAMKLAEDFSQKELAAAMNELLLEGRLVIGKVGMYQNRTPKMGLVEVSDPHK